MQGMGTFQVAGERLRRGHRVLVQVLRPQHRGVHPGQEGTQHLVQILISRIIVKIEFVNKQPVSP